MRFGPVGTAAILLCLVLILPSCGDEQTAAAGRRPAAGSSKATPSGATAKAVPATRRCSRSLGDLLDSMESLDNTLAVGLDYQGYLDAVNHIRAAYAGVQVDQLPIVCLARVAGPAEQALNAYIDGVNTWGNCLATAGCNPESVESDLRRGWARASGRLAEAQSGLRGI